MSEDKRQVDFQGIIPQYGFEFMIYFSDGRRAQWARLFEGEEMHARNEAFHLAKIEGVERVDVVKVTRVKTLIAYPDDKFEEFEPFEYCGETHSYYDYTTPEKAAPPEA